jgi:hypothetical protein
MSVLGRVVIVGLAVLIGRQTFADGANLFATSWTEGKRIDAERALPPTTFYKSPLRLAPDNAGSLIRSEVAQEYSLPPGVTATRILYYTRTSAGVDAVSSGVVLVPYGTPPPGGWPLIAWSHGTSGVARSCAPSLMRSLFYNWEGLYEYVMLGFAVVATDYAGLGTDGRHAYVDMLSNGADVIYSVPAARAAVSNLSSKWVIVGHSQGGLSSLGAAQLEAAKKDPGYLGTVALAGASDLEDLIDAALAAKAPVLNGLLAFGVYGFQTVYPQLAAESVLTAAAATQYSMYVTDGCSAASGAFGALPVEGMYRSDWKRDRSLGAIDAGAHATGGEARARPAAPCHGRCGSPVHRQGQRNGIRALVPIRRACPTQYLSRTRTRSPSFRLSDRTDRMDQGPLLGCAGTEQLQFTKMKLPTRNSG